jgi:hypothetical protein
VLTPAWNPLLYPPGQIVPLTTFQSNLDELQEIAQTLPQGDARRVQLEEIRQSMGEIAVNMKSLIDRF